LAISKETEEDAANEPQREFNQRAVYLVALSVGLTTMSFNVWYPFLPLYALKLGATSDADALFWIAIATTVQGIGRLTTGPIWGVLSDRYGRKSMLLRALFLSTTTGAIAAFVQAPWQLTIAMGVNGVFSGLVPPAVALISVSVPEHRLNNALSIVTGAQYMGTTIGPALGAALTIAFGYRGSIFVASMVPFLAAFTVLFWVPGDHVERKQKADNGVEAAPLEPFRPTGQFLILVFVYFAVFAMNQLVRLATPIALRLIEAKDDVAGEAGLVFSLGGAVSAFSVLILGPRFFREGTRHRTMAIAFLIGGAGFLALAGAQGVELYLVGYLMIAAVLSAMVPTTNTLIAATVSRARRGTAFGFAGSAQAMSFVVGPSGAALFAAISLDAGFALLAGLLVVLAGFIFLALVDPAAKLSAGQSAVASEPEPPRRS
jgi:DHA1 family multidrug resistance protein-like MFS transporter